MVELSVFIFSILLTIILTLNFYTPFIKLLRGTICGVPPVCPVCPSVHEQQPQMTMGF